MYFKVCKYNDTNFKVFTIYLFSMLVINIYSGSLHYYGITNLFLSHYYFLIQFVLLSYFYYNLFDNKNIKKGVLITGIIVVSCISVYYIYNPKIYFKFNLFEIVLSSIPLIIYTILYIFISLLEEKKYFYINCGIFIYLISSTLFFVSGNYLATIDSSVIKIIWLVNLIIYIIYQLLIVVEWFVNYRVIKKNKV